MRTVDWQDGHVVVIDQTLLPAELRVRELHDTDDVVDAIRRLVVRGAPAIGACGGLGVAMAACAVAGDEARLRAEAERIVSARPTAVNLRWAVDRVLAAGPDADAMLAEALRVLDEDAATNRALSARGADLVGELCGDRPVTVHTHCNAGALACVEYGTALGVVRALHERGRIREVVADETRPLLQGARLTAFELRQLAVPYRVVVDAAAPSVITGGLVDVVVVGADRVAANGDVANKIGTLSLALAARYAGVPFVVAAPESTVDPTTPSGAAIEIEQRGAAEVLAYGTRRSTPDDARAYNPAFDITPAELVSAVVTERRVVRPANGERLVDHENMISRGRRHVEAGAG
ncbi:MAG: S-methyl-5-thioribose-1-phosphate isomerase [Streptosporangiales bacterium]|nr:S-methyl-5-thioribose-1-phosphate isomerase [Streptosporangiales bacterium]